MECVTPSRVDRLRGSFEGHSVDALLVTRRENVRYVTGFSGSSGAALVLRDEVVLVTDFRYIEQAAMEAPGCRVERHGPNEMNGVIAEVARGAGVRNLGFEGDSISWDAHRKLEEALAGVRLVPVEGACERLRMVKDEAEQELIRRAEAVGDLAFSHILEVIRPGMTEADVAVELEWFMRKHGAEKAAFDTIVASGPRGAMPHASASQKRLARGELVVIDFGAVVEGYCGDCTRTVSLGRASAEARKVYDTVLRAQLAALDALAAGVKGEDVHAVAHGVIAGAGYGDMFGHGLGHGVGLAVHEDPRLAPSSRTELACGMTVTVEPGIYLPGVMGVRIEDVVVVAADGARNLTRSPKELLEL